METVKLQTEYFAECVGCGEARFFQTSDFLLLNGERICFWTCDDCDEKMKIVKE